MACKIKPKTPPKGLPFPFFPLSVLFAPHRLAVHQEDTPGMKRRDFVGGLAVAAGLAGCAKPQGDCGGVTGQSTETFEWSCVTSWPPRFPGLGMAVENLADRLDAASGGRLKIKVYGGGELVPAFEVF